MSCATLTAVAVCENPRQLGNSRKTLILDVQIYMGDEEIPLTGAFRYFNDKDVVFGGLNTLIIHATVSGIILIVQEKCVLK
jgi:hypothetical protein